MSKILPYEGRFAGLFCLVKLYMKGCANMSRSPSPEILVSKNETENRNTEKKNCKFFL